MKQNILKKSIHAALGVAMLGLAVMTQSFNSKFADVTWYFNSNNPSEIADASKWTQTNPMLSGCSSANLALPCQLNTPEEVSDQTELADHFTNVYSNNANSIKSAAASRRAQP